MTLNANLKIVYADGHHQLAEAIFSEDWEGYTALHKNGIKSMQWGSTTLLSQRHNNRGT